MKFKKLLDSLSHSGLSRLSRNSFAQKSDSTMPVVALVAGLAIGAALSVLFAPKKGEETRGMLADGANNLSDSLMKKFNAAKKRLLNAEEEAMEIKEQAVENVRKKTKKAADKLSGSEDESKNNPSEIKVPSAGTQAWKENADA
jgi:gas vesicle protein